MSKVSVIRSVAKDYFPVQVAALATGWNPGQAAALNSQGYIVLGSVDNVIGILIDDDTECVAPPSGSLATVVYGAGCRLQISHAAEVAAGSSVRAYDSSCESAIPTQNLYINASGSFSTSITGSVKGKVIGVPAAANNYTLDLKMVF